MQLFINIITKHVLIVDERTRSNVTTFVNWMINQNNYKNQLRLFTNARNLFLKTQNKLMSLSKKYWNCLYIFFKFSKYATNDFKWEQLKNRVHAYKSTNDKKVFVFLDSQMSINVKKMSRFLKFSNKILFFIFFFAYRRQFFKFNEIQLCTHDLSKSQSFFDLMSSFHVVIWRIINSTHWIVNARQFFFAIFRRSFV